ncbi:MAG: ATPase domain-containing protein [Thermoplasmata archaeon]
MKVVTGIEALDKGLHGGFPSASGILFFSEVIAEKRIFAEQFVVAGLRRDEVCLYVDFYRAPQFTRRELSKFGDFPEDKLVLVDVTSAQTLLASKERYRVRELENLSEILQTIMKAIEETGPARVILDSLDFLTERFSKDDVVEFLRELMSFAKAAGSVVGLLFVNWSYDQEDLEDILAYSDYVLEFKTSLKGGVLLNKLRLRENFKDGLTTNWIPFSFKELMGLVIYFPRVLVTGPYHAGKSTLVQQLSQTAISVDRMGTTIAFDYGSVEISGVEVELLGTPGQERFEFIFKIFAREVNGILLVVDSTHPAELSRAREMRRLAGEHLPLVVVANKRDLPDVMSLEDIRGGLQLEERVPIVETVATEGEGVRVALEKLIEIIIWGWPDE